MSVIGVGKDFLDVNKPKSSISASAVYKASQETRQTGSAGLTIPTLFLVLPDKLYIKRH